MCDPVPSQNSVFPGTLLSKVSHRFQVSTLFLEDTSHSYKPLTHLVDQTKKTILRCTHLPKVSPFPHKDLPHKCLIAKVSVIGAPFQVQITFSTNHSSSRKLLTQPVNHQKGNQFFYLSIHPCGHLSCKNRPQRCLAAKTGQFDWFAKPVP